MQSRLAATGTRLNRFVIGVSGNQFQPCRFVTIPTGKATAPAIHAENPEEKNDVSEAAKASAISNGHSEDKISDEDPYVAPEPYPSVTSPKIKSTGVKQPTEPISQQKRRVSANPPSVKASEVSCVGFDGFPGPDESREKRDERKDQEEDDKEYYKHHKASPLSQIEMVDTRKPITRATDETADGYIGDYGAGIKLWMPEQLDTAEDSLRRAMEIWKWNATRGDPNSPHGRVLRALRGEYW